ncbi:MAG: hypothetical protein IH859_07800, partial [Chloroflexi bacterium]|nr:hypothetical protein [Chloroflexota bacterium]
IGHALNLFDLWFVDRGLVDGIARIPKLLGKVFQPLQNGILQSYGVSMAGGAGLIAVLVIVMPDLMQWLGNLLGGGG